MSSPPGAVAPGSTTRLIWYSENAQAAGISNGIGHVSVPSGYVDVHPSVSTLYTMTVSNTSGINTCGALVTIAVPNPPTLLTYYPPVVQPIVFTPITYSNVYVPYGGYGGYYVPYSNSAVMYDDWYDRYPSRVYSNSSQKYDFWSDYTRGPSTGPSWFGETYSRRNMPYTEVTGETLTNGDTRSITRECIDGIGCRITGANHGWTVPDGEPGPLDDVPAARPQIQPRGIWASDEGSGSGDGSAQLILTGTDAPLVPISTGPAYAENSYYSEGSYPIIPASSYLGDSDSRGTDPYLIQTSDTHRGSDGSDQSYYEEI